MSLPCRSVTPLPVFEISDKGQIPPCNALHGFHSRANHLIDRQPPQSLSSDPFPSQLRLDYRGAMPSSEGQRRGSHWKRNVIEKQKVTGYITAQKLLNRLMVLFPYVASDDEFALDTVSSRTKESSRTSSDQTKETVEWVGVLCA
jgi:hypothetical protein